MVLVEKMRASTSEQFFDELLKAIDCNWLKRSVQKVQKIVSLRKLNKDNTLDFGFEKI